MTGEPFPSKFEFSKACLTSKQHHTYGLWPLLKTVPEISNMSGNNHKHQIQFGNFCHFKMPNQKKALTIRIFKIQPQNGFGTHCGTWLRESKRQIIRFKRSGRENTTISVGGLDSDNTLWPLAISSTHLALSL